MKGAFSQVVRPRVVPVVRLTLAVGFGLVAAALVGYGLLLLLAIPSSDTATSSLVFTGLLLMLAGAFVALLAVMLYRAGRQGKRA